VIANILTIAGTDPTGGAGIQADLKTFSALGAYGMSAVTAVVAQNTRGVRSFVALEPAFVADQIDAVFDDVRVDAVKIGMVANAGIAEAIAGRLARHPDCPVVLDPVMVAKSGDLLLAPEAVAAVRELLVPRARVITPNLPEAGVLLGAPAPASLEAMRETAAALGRLGAEWVLLKGGHLAGPDSPDLLQGGGATLVLPAPRLATRHTHGAGCTLAAALAALLPGLDLPAAAARAKAYLTAAMAAAGRLQVGTGKGPVHHFHALWAD
jgi:hydroxymethylpyrimidine/phosphomethylpyrimidine kinase